jgi:hypothetical protein
MIIVTPEVSFTVTHEVSFTVAPEVIFTHEVLLTRTPEM